MVPATGPRPTSTPSPGRADPHPAHPGPADPAAVLGHRRRHFAVPSLSAALLLGLREQIGGHPDHIRIEQVVDPTLTDGTDNHDAHPAARRRPRRHRLPRRARRPGPTPGPARALAWGRVRDCECRHEDRLACHRCLLPFVAPAQRPDGSRGPPPSDTCARCSGWPSDAEQDTDGATGRSPRSRRQRTSSRTSSSASGRLILAPARRRRRDRSPRCPGRGATPSRFTLPGQPRQWTLTPQVQRGELQARLRARVHRHQRARGRHLHRRPRLPRRRPSTTGSPTTPRSDEILRDTGRIVLGITSRDVSQAESGTGTGSRTGSRKLSSAN